MYYLEREEQEKRYTGIVIVDYIDGMVFIKVCRVVPTIFLVILGIAGVICYHKVVKFSPFRISFGPIVIFTRHVADKGVESPKYENANVIYVQYTKYYE